jgi:hypothetical protein
MKEGEVKTETKKILFAEGNTDQKLTIYTREKSLSEVLKMV